MLLLFSRSQKEERNARRKLIILKWKTLCGPKCLPFIVDSSSFYNILYWFSFFVVFLHSSHPVLFNCFGIYYGEYSRTSMYFSILLNSSPICLRHVSLTLLNDVLGFGSSSCVKSLVLQTFTSFRDYDHQIWISEGSIHFLNPSLPPQMICLQALSIGIQERLNETSSWTMVFLSYFY